MRCDWAKSNGPSERSKIHYFYTNDFMTSKATSPQQYLDELPADRKEAVTKLRNTVVKIF
jgi:hypothetical protein